MHSCTTAAHALGKIQRANGSHGTYYHALSDGGYSLGTSDLAGRLDPSEIASVPVVGAAVSSLLLRGRGQIVATAPIERPVDLAISQRCDTPPMPTSSTEMIIFNCDANERPSEKAPAYPKFLTPTFFPLPVTIHNGSRGGVSKPGCLEIDPETAVPALIFGVPFGACTAELLCTALLTLSP